MYNAPAVAKQTPPENAQQAVGYWTCIIARQPCSAHAYSERANAWLELDRSDKALADLDMAVRIEPSNGLRYAERAGLLFLDKDRQESALADITRAIEFDPNNHEYRMLRGIILGSSHREAAATDDMTAIVKADPDNGVARMMRGFFGMIAVSNGDAQASTQAMTDFAAAEKSLGDEGAGLRLMQAVLLIQAGKLDEAAEMLSRCLDDDRDAPQVYQMRAEVYRTQGKHALALADLEASIRIAPDKWHGYGRKAWVLATCTDPQVRNGKLAVEMARRACELSEWSQSMQQNLAAAYAECGDFAEAIEWQTKAIEKLDAKQNAPSTTASHAQNDPNKKAVKTIVLWSSEPPKKKYEAKRQEAVVRLEGYRESKPLRE
jgi:serine/threonine-protein kinase